MQVSRLRITEFNGWPVFWLLFALTTATLAVFGWGKDFSDPATVSACIALSVQASVPWLYLAFAAFSLCRLLPGNGSRWLLRNRRYVGLAYAAGMGWQLLFIVWLVLGHFPYYQEVADNPYDLAEELPGYVFLIAMVITSLGSGRNLLQPRAWKRLHTVGIYYLWAETWSTYWWYSFYYEDPRLIYPVYFWAGLLAWGLRLLAWSRDQMKQRNKERGSSQSSASYGAIAKA
jgi:hypothetical protein